MKAVEVLGRVVKDAGAVTPEVVDAIGFRLSDKKSGPFEMEVEWICLERAETAVRR